MKARVEKDGGCTLYVRVPILRALCTVVSLDSLGTVEDNKIILGTYERIEPGMKQEYRPVT